MFLAGALVYTDDTPMPLAMLKMWTYMTNSLKHSQSTLKPTRQKCLHVSTATCSHQIDSRRLALFHIAGKYIEYVDSWPHLGHIL